MPNNQRKQQWAVRNNARYWENYEKKNWVRTDSIIRSTNCSDKPNKSWKKERKRKPRKYREPAVSSS